MSPFDQAVAEIDTFGFTLLPGVLTASQVRTLRAALIRVAAAHGEAGYENRGGTSLLVRNLPTLDPVFLQIVDTRSYCPSWNKCWTRPSCWAA